MYTQFQRFIATTLLFSLLLQSCGNPNWKMVDGPGPKPSAKESRPVKVRQTKTTKPIQEQDTSLESFIEPRGSLSNKYSPDSLVEVSAAVYVDRSSVPAAVSARSPLLYTSPQQPATSSFPSSASILPKKVTKHTIPNPHHAVLDKPSSTQRVSSRAKQAASEHVTDLAPYVMERNKSLPVILPVATPLSSKIATQERANTTLQSAPAVISGPFTISPNTQVVFTQVDDRWQAVVQEKIGSFSRELRLPVVSEENIATVLASLAEKKVAYIKNRIHLLDTDQASKVVYVGEMGLLGGGFWRSFGRALGHALVVGVACVAVGALVVASGGTLAIALGALSTTVGLGLFAGFGTVLTFGVSLSGQLQARKTVLDEIAITAQGFKKTEQEITSSIESLIEKLDTQLERQRTGVGPSGSGGYEYKNRAEYLKTFEEHKTQIQDHLSRLERYRNHKDLWDKDKPGIDGEIRDREQMLRYINEKIKEVSHKLRDQARGVFEQERSAWESEYNESYDKVGAALSGITCANGTARANDDFASMCNCLNTNIGHYKSWEQEPALFAADQIEIGRIREAAEKKIEAHSLTKQLIDYATADPINARIMQGISQANGENLNRYCRDAVRDGQVVLVHYAIEYNGLPVNSADSRGNTLLNQAVQHNQAEVVSYLIRQGADKSKVNRKGETPLSWARIYNNAAIMALLE